MRAKPEYYRKLAEKSRNMAAVTRGEDMKTHLLKVAEQYDNLAEEVESQTNRKGSPDARAGAALYYAGGLLTLHSTQRAIKTPSQQVRSKLEGGRMPTVDAARVVALDGLPDALLKVRYHLMQEMLPSGPLSVVEIVPLSAHRAHGHFTIRVREDCNVRLTLAADDLELTHATPH